jgi:hypothetical protein
MREEMAVDTATPEKTFGKAVKKKDLVTVEINIPRGIDIVYLCPLELDGILGKDVLTRKDVPFQVTISRDDNVRLRGYRHALIVNKVQEEK